MSKKAKVTVAAVVVLAGALVLANFSTSWAQVPGMPMKMLTLVLEGNYRVKFDCLFSDKSTKSDKEEQVKKIEFHPEYIVIENQNGSGRIVPVHAIKQLTWEQS